MIKISIIRSLNQLDYFSFDETTTHFQYYLNWFKWVLLLECIAMTYYLNGGRKQGDVVYTFPLGFGCTRQTIAASIHHGSSHSISSLQKLNNSTPHSNTSKIAGTHKIKMATSFRKFLTNPLDNSFQWLQVIL